LDVSLLGGKLELTDQNTARGRHGEAGAVAPGGQREREIGHQETLAHLGLAADEQNALRGQQARLDPARRRRGGLLGE